MARSKLTKALARYLKKLDWDVAFNDDRSWIIAYPPQKDGFPRSFNLIIPITTSKRDAHLYFGRILTFIKSNYPSEDTEMEMLELLNSRLAFRYKSKAEWIQPDFKSVMPSKGKYDPYFPSMTTWR